MTTQSVVCTSNFVLANGNLSPACQFLGRTIMCGSVLLLLVDCCFQDRVNPGACEEVGNIGHSSTLHFQNGPETSEHF